MAKGTRVLLGGGLVVLIAGALVALFTIQVGAEYEREESYTDQEAYTVSEAYTDREPYSVQVEVPLTYKVLNSRSYRDGVFDVWDHQEISLSNDDTAHGTFQVQCQFRDQRGGVRRDTQSLTLAPGQTGTVKCKADTYQTDEITYKYDVVPGKKSITEIRYREVTKYRDVTRYRDVPKTRVVIDRCTVTRMKKLSGGSC